MGIINNRPTQQTHIDWRHVDLKFTAPTHAYASYQEVSMEFLRILESANKTYEFRSMLRTLDKMTGKSVRVKWLQFWLAARTLTYLSKTDDLEGVKEQLKKMYLEFFHDKNQIDLLSGSEVYKACKTVCANGLVGAIRPIIIAQRNVGRKLDELHRDCYFKMSTDSSTQTINFRPNATTQNKASQTYDFKLGSQQFSSLK